MAAALAELECEHDSGIVDELGVCSSYGPAISLAQLLDTSSKDVGGSAVTELCISFSLWWSLSLLFAQDAAP